MSLTLPRRYSLASTGRAPAERSARNYPFSGHPRDTSPSGKGDDGPRPRTWADRRLLYMMIVVFLPLVLVLEPRTEFRREEPLVDAVIGDELGQVRDG